MNTSTYRSRFDQHTQAFVTEHPFFVHLRSGAMHGEEARRFIQAFEHLVGRFPAVVERAGERAGAAPIRAILAENLDDERGNGDPSRSHHQIFRLFLSSNEVPLLDEEPRPMADGWQRRLIWLLDEADGDGEVLGLLAAEEFLAIPCLSRMYEVIAQHYPGGDHEYFTTHLALEEEHMTELLEAMQTLERADLRRVMPGFHRAMRAWERYFDEMLAWLQAPGVQAA